MEIKITDDNNTTENFLERYKGKSIWNLAWSLYWRGSAIYLVGAFVIGVIIALISG